MSDVTIDKVQIEVEASAKSANKVLEQLERNLKSVKSAMAGFDTSGIEKLQKALDGIGKAANNASNVKVTPKVDTSNITKSEKQISSSVANLQDRFTRLGALANAALGGDKSAITSFQRQAVSMQAEIDVVQNKLRRLGDTRIASDTFARLIQQSNVLDSQLTDMKHQMDAIMSGKKVVSDNQFKNLSENIVKTRTELDSVNDKMREMEKAGTAYLGDPFQKYRDGVATTQKSLDGLRDKVDSIKEKKPSVDTSKVIANIQQAIKWTNNLIKKLLSLGGAAISKVLHGIGNAFNKIKDGASKTRSAVGKLSGVFDKGFMKILKYGLGIRSIYVLFRRLRKAVVESFGELQKSGAFFQTTKANIEGLKTSLATLKFQFGAAFEPIFNTVAPALQSFINYLIKAMNVLSAFIAKVSGKDTYSKVAAVTLAAANNTASAARAAKELNKQLQGFDELNNLTTNDNAGGGGGGGGGASGDSAVYEEASVESALGDFGKALADAIAKGDWELVGKTIGDKLTAELKKLNEKWPEIFAAANDFGTNLAKFFNGLISDDLFGEVGEAIGSAINAALTASLAFAKEFHWDDLGSAIATGIDEFVKTNPLKLVVDNFNEWANGILDTLITAVDKLLEKGTIDKISEHIAKALAELEIGEIAWKVGKLGSSLATSLYKIVSNKETWINLGQKIADGINGFFAGMNEKNEDGDTGWKVLGENIEKTFVGIGTSLITALEGVDWIAVGNAIADFISGIDWNEVKEITLDCLGAIKKAIIDVLDGANIDVGDVTVTLLGVGLLIAAITGINLAATITKAALSAMITPLVEKLITSGAAIEIFKAGAGLALTVAKVTLGIAAALAVGYAVGKSLGDLIVDGLLSLGIISAGAANEYFAANDMSITQKISDIKLAWSTKDENGVSDLKKGWDLMWDEIYGPVFDEGRDIGVKIKEVVFSLAKGAKSIASSWADFWGDQGEKAYEVVHATVELVKATGQKAWTTVTAWVTATGTAVSATVELIKAAGLNAWTTVTAWVASFGTTVESAVTLAQSGWSSVTAWVTSFGTDVISNVSLAISTTKEALKEKIQKVADGVSGVTAKVGTALEDTKDSLKQKIKDVIAKAKGLSAGISLKISTKASALSASIKRIINSIKGKAVNLALNFSAAAQDLKNWINTNVINKINDKFKQVPILKNHLVPTLKAEGGVTNTPVNTIWGEKGSEALIPLERNLNGVKKIAAVMLDGMEKVSKYRYSARPSALAFGGSSMSQAYVGSMSRGDSEALQEQNKLLAEQNRLLQIIANKDVTISSRDVFNATRSEAQNYNNRTGNSPFLF